MLFDKMENKMRLLWDIRKEEQINGYEVLYAGLVGSVSQGLSDHQSDWDVKCLWVRPGKFLGQPQRHIEDCIRYRKFYNGKIYDCIAFWEVSAFFNFLSEPYIDRGNNYGLFHNVVWLMRTPYRFDPLGLQNKISILLDQCIDIENEKLWHYTKLSQLLKDEGNVRNCLRILYELLSLDYMCQTGSLSPVHLETLLSAYQKGQRADYIHAVKYFKQTAAHAPEEKKEEEEMIDWVRSQAKALKSRMSQCIRLQYDYSFTQKNYVYTEKMIEMALAMIQEVGECV